jgi:hypothetical protein
MANTLPCGQCIHYAELRKPKDRGGYKSLRKGHCLDKTIFAKNKPGNHVYPPNAKVEDLPFQQHKITLVKEKEIILHCTAAKRRVTNG